MSSRIIEDAPQPDSRRSVRERHTIGDGIQEDVSYLAEPDADVEAMLPERAALIERRLADQAAESEAKAGLEKAQAEELLKLGDESIKAILLLHSREEVEQVKAEMEERTAK